jgi:hypothetical protein
VYSWNAVQKLKATDVISPEEFEWAVEGCFLDISRDAEYQVGSTPE